LSVKYITVHDIYYCLDPYNIKQTKRISIQINCSPRKTTPVSKRQSSIKIIRFTHRAFAQLYCAEDVCSIVA